MIDATRIGSDAERLTVTVEGDVICDVTWAEGARLSLARSPSYRPEHHG